MDHTQRGSVGATCPTLREIHHRSLRSGSSMIMTRLTRTKNQKPKLFDVMRVFHSSFFITLDLGYWPVGGRQSPAILAYQSRLQVARRLSPVICTSKMFRTIMHGLYAAQDDMVQIQPSNAKSIQISSTIFWKARYACISKQFFWLLRMEQQVWSTGPMTVSSLEFGINCMRRDIWRKKK